jgi:hypothetical protein
MRTGVTAGRPATASGETFHGAAAAARPQALRGDSAGAGAGEGASWHADIDTAVVDAGRKRCAAPWARGLAPSTQSFAAHGAATVSKAKSLDMDGRRAWPAPFART